MRRPFARPFYGWSIIAVAFVTMGIGVNARTAFSLFFPPILDEFGWPRGLTAGPVSLWFFLSAFLGPAPGPVIGRRRPPALLLLRAARAGPRLPPAAPVPGPWRPYPTPRVLL